MDQGTRTLAIEALVDNSDRRLKPGFFAKGVIFTREDSDVLAVPQDAISTMAGVSTVFIIDQGKARQQIVTLGAQKDKLVEVVDGLKGNEVLAIQPEPAGYRCSWSSPTCGRRTLRNSHDSFRH